MRGHEILPAELSKMKATSSVARKITVTIKAPPKTKWIFQFDLKYLILNYESTLLIKLFFRPTCSVCLQGHLLF